MTGRCVSHSEVRVLKVRWETCKASQCLDLKVACCHIWYFMALRQKASLDSGVEQLSPPFDGRSCKSLQNAGRGWRTAVVFAIILPLPIFSLITNHFSILPTNIYWIPTMCLALSKEQRTQAWTREHPYSHGAYFLWRVRNRQINKWINTYVKILLDGAKCSNENIRVTTC